MQSSNLLVTAKPLALTCNMNNKRGRTHLATAISDREIAEIWKGTGIEIKTRKTEENLCVCTLRCSLPALVWVSPHPHADTYIAPAFHCRQTVTQRLRHSNSAAGRAGLMKEDMSAMNKHNLRGSCHINWPTIWRLKTGK